MLYEESFISDVPRVLDKNELIILFRKAKEGSLNARNQIIEGNIRIVLHIVINKFKDSTFEKKELVSIGLLGLIKAVDNYDVEKGYEFTTFATKCITNEILMAIRKNQRVHYLCSLDEPITNDERTESGLLISDKLCSDVNLVLDYEQKEEYERIRNIVKSLTGKKKMIVEMRYGFAGYEPTSQKDIAKKMHISQSYISRILMKTLAEIREYLCEKDKENKDIDDFSLKDNKLRTAQSFYEAHDEYPKEYIDAVIEMLKPEEKAILLARYAGDLNNQFFCKLSIDDRNKYYRSILPKIKKYLANYYDIFLRDGHIGNARFTQKDEIFKKIATKSSTKEAVIIALKFGFVDGKCYSAAAISKFLKIDKLEVLSILKNALEKYKDELQKNGRKIKL